MAFLDGVTGYFHRCIFPASIKQILFMLVRCIIPIAILILGCFICFGETSKPGSLIFCNSDKYCISNICFGLVW